MDNRQLAVMVMQQLGIKPILCHVGAVPAEDAAQDGFKEQLREAIVHDMVPSVMELAEFADREHGGDYELRATFVAFNPQTFDTFIEALSAAMIERGRLQAMPKRMGLITS